MREERALSLSILVPTFNRAGSLKRLLESVESVEYSDSVSVELLVIDNGSTDETGKFLIDEQRKPRRLPLTVLKETRKGKSSALNRGLQVAKGKILFLLDDDVVVHAKWLAGHLQCYDSTTFDAIQGKVLPGVDPQGRPADPSRLREYNIPIRDLGEKIRKIRGSIGTNMSLKREVFEKVGLFDPRLGPGASGFSEDTEYCIRIRKAGFEIGYTPQAIVYHELDPARYGRAYNRLSHYRQGVSRSIYRRKSIVFSVLPNLLTNSIRLGLYKAFGRSQKAYRTEGRILKYWGYLGGRLRRRARQGP